MKTNLRLLMALGLIGMVSASMCGARADAAESNVCVNTDNDFDDWKVKKFATGKFEASFPSEPIKAIQPNGGLEIVTYTAADSTTVYVAGYTDLPVYLDPKATAGGFFGGIAATVEGKIISQTTRKRDGEMSYLAKFKGAYNGKGMVVIKGRRLYYMIVMSPKNEMDNKSIQHFFDSLKIN